MKRIYTSLAALALVFAAALSNPAPALAKSVESESVARVAAPVNLAVLVQDDLVSRVGNELKLTRDYVRALPAGSRVMVGYLRAGSMQVRQPFTTDLEAAAKSLRIPIGSASAGPYNPYVDLRRAIRGFQPGDTQRNVVLLISDGLDVSRGFDYSSTVFSIDLDRAIREAKERNVSVYSFYAPTAGLTSYNRTAVNYGQASLNRLARETGGRAFFQGTDFVTFDSYFKRLSRALNSTDAAE